MVDKFITKNYDCESKGDKQFYYFLYCNGGSGFGKTWLGKHVPIRIREIYPTDTIIPIYIDFSNGFRYNMAVDGVESASVSLGLRIAARLLQITNFTDNFISKLGILLNIIL